MISPKLIVPGDRFTGIRLKKVSDQV